MKVKNSNVSDLGGETVTVFSRQKGNHFYGETMTRVNVGNPCFTHSLEELMVYIDPTGKQLQAIVNALKSGNITFNELKEIGGCYGGYSDIDIG